MTLPKLAVTVAVAAAATGKVVTEKVAEDSPAAIVTWAGTDAFALFEPRATTAPPVGAGPLSVRVPVEGDPPSTEAGESETLTSPAALMARLAV